jgi:hypothetical protein
MVDTKNIDLQYTDEQYPDVRILLRSNEQYSNLEGVPQDLLAFVSQKPSIVHIPISCCGGS